MEKRKIVIWIAFLISFIGVLQGLSSAVIPHFPNIEFNVDVIDCNFNENGGAIITSSDMYFVNRNNKICNISPVIGIDTPFDYVQSVTADKKGYYLLGYSYNQDSQMPDTVVLAHCDSNGRNIKELWSQASKENELIKKYNVSDILVQEDKLYIVSHDGKNLIISNYDEQTVKTVKTVKTVPVYSSDDTQCIQDVVFGDNINDVYLQNRFGNISRFNTLTGANEECCEIAYIRYASFDVDKLSATFNYSKYMWIKTGFFFLSCIVMAIIVLVTIVKLCKTKALKKAKTIIWVIVGAVTAMAFFSYAIGGIVGSSKSEEVMLTAERAKCVLEDYADQDFPLPDNIESLEAFFENDNNRYAVNNLLKFLQNFSNPNNNQSIAFSNIIFVDNAQNLYNFIDSNDKQVCGQRSVYSDFFSGMEKKGAGDVISADVGETVYRIAYKQINTDNTNYKVFVAVGTDEVNNAKFLKSTLMFELFRFIAIILTIYISLEFIFTCFKDFSEYRKKKKLNEANAGISLSNVFIFAVEIVLYLDYFLLVKVTADICNGISPARLAIMVALPLTTYRIGSWLGSALVGSIIDRIGYRKAMFIASAATIGAFLLMTYACIIRNIYILAFAKLLQGIFLESILFTLADGLPYHLDDEKERERRIANSQSANNAGIVIAIMIGGIVSEYISYSAMYIIGAAASIVFILFAFLIYGKRMTIEEECEETDHNTGRKSPWTVFIKPKALLFIVMVIIPLVLLQGYEDYLFPLFSESKGIGDLTLASIGVIANAAAYYGERILVLFKNTSKLLSIVITMCISGILLMLFVISPGIAWSVVVLIMVNILMRVIDANKVLFIADLSKGEGYSPSDIQERFYAIEDGLKAFQAPILGVFASIGSIFACVIVGLLNLFLPGGYKFLLDFIESRKTRKSLGDKGE